MKGTNIFFFGWDCTLKKKNSRENGGEQPNFLFYKIRENLEFIFKSKWWEKKISNTNILDLDGIRKNVNWSVFDLYKWSKINGNDHL